MVQGFKGVNFRKDEPFIGSLRQSRVVQRVYINTMLLFKKVTQGYLSTIDWKFVSQKAIKSIVENKLIDFPVEYIKTFQVYISLVPDLELLKGIRRYFFDQLVLRWWTLVIP